MPKLRLNKKNVEARCVLPPGKVQLAFWDTEVRSLGLLVGRRARTWILQRRFPDGRTRRMTIGRYPTFSPDMARQRAREMILDISRGVDPVAERRKAEARGVTLESATAEHVSAMKARGCSPRTVEEFPADLEKYLAAWWNRPLAQVTRIDCRKRHAELTESSGPYLANRVLQAFRAVWNTAADSRDEMPARNPVTRKFPWNKERRRREPVGDLRAWAAAVSKLSPVRRDFALFAMFTGARSGDVATIRWENVDLEAGTVHFPSPKGGDERRFTIPLSSFALEILKRRRAENEILRGEGCPWAFPSLLTGGPLVERRWGRKKGETPHRARDTFISVAREAGVGTLEVKVLVNHTYSSADVTDGYTLFSVEHLRGCVEKVAARLSAKMGPVVVLEAQEAAR